MTGALPPRSRPIRPIFQTLRAGDPGTMGAAVDAVTRLQPVADHPTAAVVAARRELVRGAFERVEDVLPAVEPDEQRTVIVVAAHFAGRHRALRMRLARRARLSGVRDVLRVAALEDLPGPLALLPIVGVH